MIGKLWKSKGWFEYSGLIGTRKEGKECFSKVELEVGDKIYIGLNRQPRSEKSPKFLFYVKKSKFKNENQLTLKDPSMS